MTQRVVGRYRLHSAVYTLFEIVLLTRIQKQIEENLPKEQTLFRTFADGYYSDVDFSSC